MEDFISAEQKEKILNNALKDYRPLKGNVSFEATSLLPISETMDEFYIRFKGSDFSSIEEIKKASDVVKLYMRIFYSKAPPEMIKQSSVSLESLIDFKEYEEHFYSLGEELRKIELVNKKTKKIYIQIKREKVYIPADFTSTLRLNKIKEVNIWQN